MLWGVFSREEVKAMLREEFENKLGPALKGLTELQVRQFMTALVIQSIPYSNTFWEISDRKSYFSRLR
ncbi:hypothetical protein FACS1894202_13920 [Clostridia bacterium]|nr:hypothetical protein FACS1894202_13920 [Clostridia bacterium]